MKNKTIGIVVGLMFLFTVNQVSAQGTPPPPTGGNSTSAPIDSGTLVLLIATACYGYTQLNKKKPVLAD